MTEQTQTKVTKKLTTSDHAVTKKGNLNRPHKRIIIFGCTITVVIFLAISSFALSENFVNADTVKGIGTTVYWNQSCTNRTQSIEWGQTLAGTNTTLTIYVQNDGGAPANLWLSTSNWSPSSASEYISLSWNYSGQTLNIGQVIPIELTLHASPYITGVDNFKFTTTITTIG